MASDKQRRKPRLDKTKAQYEKDIKRAEYEAMSFEEQMDYSFEDYDKKHSESIAAHKASLQEKNHRSKEETLTKAKLAIELLKENGFKVTPTTLSRQSGISRSYVYKTPEIMKMIEDCEEHNENVKFNSDLKKKFKMNAPTYSVDQTVLNYQLHMKLLESYVHQFQLLKTQNKYMEEKIEELKKKAADK